MSQVEMQRIGQLRYELFVERDGKKYPADHASRCFLEPVDHQSLNFQAVDQGRCLAALRLTRGQDALKDGQLAATLLNFGLARPPYSDCLVLSRLAVRKEFRARIHILDLLRHTYVVGLINGARYALLATRPVLVPMFERFGFLPTARLLDDPIAGELQILVLEIRNRERLVAASSPLLGELDAFLTCSSL